MSALTAKQKAFLALARSHPEGIADDAVEKALPEMGLEERMKIINELAAKSLITFMRQGNSLLYKAKTDAEAGKMAMMDDHERIIYQHIEDADNEGIWLKRLRDRTGLPAKVVDRCIKKMEQKLLIKSVASVKFPTRKIYMLFDLTPSVELTGGPWYTDQELDVDFIDTLATQCYKFILSRSFPTNKPGAIYGPEYTFYPTAGQIRRFIMDNGISTVDLSVGDINTLLNVLVYDGKVERRAPVGDLMDWDDDEDEDAGGRAGRRAQRQKKPTKEPEYMYKAIRNKLADTALVDIPCGKCPVYEKCSETGLVSPSNCVYFKNWLEF